MITVFLTSNKILGMPPSILLLRCQSIQQKGQGHL